MPVTRFALHAAFLFLLAGCGGSPKPEKPAPGADAAAVPLTVVDPATAVTISGSIALEGTPPAEESINMSADPVCKNAHAGQQVVTERAVVKDGRVQWAFIHIKEGLEGKRFAVPETPVELDQVGCRYTPHVLGIMAGQQFKMLNSDDTLHNVHAQCQNCRAFNVGLAVRGMSVSRKFDKPEIMVPVKCDVHSWMQAFVGVTTHPFYAVSDAAGAYTISGLPPGTYTLEAWHETFGTRTQSITVAPGEAKTVDFTFKAS